MTKYLSLALSAALAAAELGGTAHAYDEFEPRSRRPAVVQEQSSGRPPLRKYELIVKNRTTSEVIAVYAKSIRMRNLSVDLIPGTSIRQGRQGLIELYDGGESCEWYVKADLADGRSASTTMNVCSTTEWTVSGY